jgi:hypothetical protein
MRIILLIVVVIGAALFLLFPTNKPTGDTPVSSLQGNHETDKTAQEPVKQAQTHEEQSRNQEAKEKKFVTLLSAELLHKFDDNAAENADLLSLFHDFESKYQDRLSVDERKTFARAVDRLARSFELYQKALTQDNNDRLTIVEKLGLWQETKFDRLSENDAAYVREQREKYQASINAYASISGPGDFQTSNNVSEHMPVGISDRFSGPTVWIWARVNAPRKEEKLSLQWIAEDGAVLKTVSAKVLKNTGKGYRIYYYKNFYQPGAYEARLYNSRNDLIGIRSFQILSGPS